jgi:hypothetical protein
MSNVHQPSVPSATKLASDQLLIRNQHIGDIETLGNIESRVLKKEFQALDLMARYHQLCAINYPFA